MNICFFAGKIGKHLLDSVTIEPSSKQRERQVQLKKEQFV